MYYMNNKYYKYYNLFTGDLMGRQTITVSLPEKLSEKLKAYCSHSERPKSWLVQKALEDYFDNMEDLEIALTRKLDPTDEEMTLKEARRKLGLSD